ncbi:hypothetical protein L2E82_10980 [Cichorium intybus]|uniref:Uncharacterized protein n=1 Tax=Cichorium intybus TaxID=13427 RepID=A0ACB9GBJ2_CICIN|nr:hypothetical protein L2E82_10980 [Cichorium intybus]
MQGKNNNKKKMVNGSYCVWSKESPGHEENDDAEEEQRQVMKNAGDEGDGWRREESIEVDPIKKGHPHKIRLTFDHSLQLLYTLK